MCMQISALYLDDMLNNYIILNIVKGLKLYNLHRSRNTTLSVSLESATGDNLQFIDTFKNILS